jgi:nitroimidazol reductase NimA-like FMN-containing flavoprotein (pyridoxamine 5'-phosphate oxidase superfamily)
VTGAGPAAGRQRRGRVIAMSEPERDAYLATERVCRLATVGNGGRPRVTPASWDFTKLATLAPKAER